ncbi:MAG: hypothetical protein ACK42Z_09000 [Candidatus Kapaibacteriota bacterium]
MNTNKFLVAVSLVLTIIVLMQYLNKHQCPNYKLVRVDTVQIVKVVEKVQIQKAKPRIIYKHDTIYQSSGFIAQLDTVIQKDTVKASYEFPQNLMSIEISRANDTLRVPTFQYSLQKKKSTWLEYATPFFIGTAVGFLFGKTN